MGVEKVQQRLAFGRRQAVDAGGEAGVHIERLAARSGVGAHDRVFGAGIDLAGVVDPPVGIAAAIEVLGFVRGGQAGEEFLQRRRQRLEGGVHAGEQRIAADRRQHAQLQARAQRRLGVARHVGVPAIAIGEFGILVGVDDEYFRMALGARRRRMVVQFAKPLGERHMDLRRQRRLVAEEQHQMFGKSPLDLREAVVRQMLEIGADHFGADEGGHGFDTHVRILRREC